MEGRATASVRMRSEPSTNGAILGALDPGAVVGLRFRLPDGGWFAVKRPDGLVGWVDFLVVDPAIADRVNTRAKDAAIVIPPTAVPVRREPAKPARNGCDPSYPTICIPAGSADLDCGEIPWRRFQVVGRDPHGFDRDRDGIGCEAN